MSRRSSPPATTWHALAFVLAMLATGIVWGEGGGVPPAPGSVAYALASMFVAVVALVIVLLLIDLVRRRRP